MTYAHLMNNFQTLFTSRCVFHQKSLLFWTLSYYHPSITLFMEQLPTLRVTLFQEELPTLRVITLFQEKLLTLRVITLFMEKLPTLRVITRVTVSSFEESELVIGALSF